MLTAEISPAPPPQIMNEIASMAASADSEIDSELVSVVESADKQPMVVIHGDESAAASTLLATSQLPLVLMTPLLSEDEQDGEYGEGNSDQQDDHNETNTSPSFKFMTSVRRSRHSDPLPEMLDLISSSTSSSSRASISSAPSVTKGPWTKEVCFVCLQLYLHHLHIYVM